MNLCNILRNSPKNCDVPYRIEVFFSFSIEKQVLNVQYVWLIQMQICTKVMQHIHVGVLPPFGVDLFLKNPSSLFY